MAEEIAVAPGVRVPAAALSFRAVRASGPGGQHVNKVASKVELRVDLDLVEGLSADARDRLRVLAGPRLDADGRLLVFSQQTRDQHRNLADARDKVRRLVARALTPPRPRRPTRPSAGSREDRLREKKRRTSLKRGRAAPGGDED